MAWRYHQPSIHPSIHPSIPPSLPPSIHPSIMTHTPQNTGLLPAGLRDGGHAAGRRRSRAHAPRSALPTYQCIQYKASTPSIIHSFLHSVIPTIEFLLTNTPHKTNTPPFFHSFDERKLLAERGLTHRDHPSAVLAHAPGGLGPLPAGPRAAHAPGGEHGCCC
jgi:hypothetical protein